MATSARTQSTITDAQIGQLTDRLRTKLRRSDLSAASVQLVLAAPGNAVIDEICGVLDRHVRTAGEITSYAVPGEPRVLRMFTIGRHLSDDDLAKEFELRKLVPVSPRALDALNTANPSLAFRRPFGTHWREDGTWQRAAFGLKKGVPHMFVGRDDRGWPNGWWFAGHPKDA